MEKFDEFFNNFINAASITKSSKKTNQQDNNKLAKNKLPAPYVGLLGLQQHDGRWISLPHVLSCLEITPLCSYFPKMSPWEEATLFAVAFIRQAVDWFVIIYVAVYSFDNIHTSVSISTCFFFLLFSFFPLTNNFTLFQVPLAWHCPRQRNPASLNKHQATPLSSP